MSQPHPRVGVVWLVIGPTDTSLAREFLGCAPIPVGGGRPVQNLTQRSTSCTHVATGTFLAGCKIQQSARACAGGVVERAADSRIIVNNISAATSNMHQESIEFDCGIRWRDIGPSDRRIRIVRRSKTVSCMREGF